MPTNYKNHLFNMENKNLVPIVNLRNTYIASGSALLYIVVVGMLTSYSAPATADMKKPGSRYLGITPNEITWIGSLPNLGCVIGNFLSGFVTQKIGRKGVMIFSSMSYMTSWLLIAYSQTITYIYIGRLVGGICAGLCIVAVPTYLVEIAPTEIRGKLASGFQIAYTVGALLVMSLGIVLRWSWLAVCGATLTACAVCLMVIMPESPHWLVHESRTAEAMKGLKFLKGKHSDTDKELQDIVINLANLKEEGSNVKGFLNPIIYKPTFIALFLVFFQQFCGSSPLMSYTVDIFESTNSAVDPTIAAAIIAAVQVVGTILSGNLMDISGRRQLYITSGICMTLALMTFGIYSYIHKQYVIEQLVFRYIPLISFIIYIFSYSLGVGPVPYVMMPEMVPIQFRSTVIAMAGVWCSILAFVLNKVFHDMMLLLGDYGVYWTYAFFSLLSAVYGYFVLPETKGLTILEISKSFSGSGSIALT